jgi:hypothetical protein
MTDIRERVDRLDWGHLRDQLDEQGHAVTPPLLDDAQCEALSDLFDDGHFRSTIDMARHRFGEGRYRYFDHPLPEAITALRAAFYRRLAPIANDWAQLLRGDNPTTSAAASSCSSSSARGRRAGRTCSTRRVARSSSSPRASARTAAPAAITAWACATGSPPSRAGSAPRSA